LEIDSVSTGACSYGLNRFVIPTGAEGPAVCSILIETEVKIPLLQPAFAACQTRRLNPICSAQLVNRLG
jgi:hypothetical protein